MTKKIHFISDVHLSPIASTVNRTFIEYLRNLSDRETARVLILGDLFEVWYHDSTVLWEAYGEVLDALRAVAERGIDIDFCPGNRDFLFGEGSEREKLPFIHFHKENVCVETPKRRILASHGDELCVDDVGYQSWRRFSRSRTAKRVFHALPEFLKAWFVRRISKASTDAIKRKPGKAFRIPDSVYIEILRNSCDTIVHGHVHREEIRNFPETGGSVRTISDWTSKPNALVYDPDEDYFSVKSLFYSE